MLSNKRYRVFWLLFDDGTMSYYNALKYTAMLNGDVLVPMGIQKHDDIDEYVCIDLSLSNRKLIDKLNCLPAPDVILASPPCEAFGNANTMSIITGDLQFKDYEWFEETNITKAKMQRRNFYGMWNTLLLGMSTLLTTVKVIKMFNPKIWCIENPQTSKMWGVISKLKLLGGIKNNVWYSDFSITHSRKPTTLFSNIVYKFNPLFERKKETRGMGLRNTRLGHNERSDIPEELILQIYDNIVEVLGK